jgi:hypothetical protein
MKRCGLRHAFPFAEERGAAWVATEKKATLDHVFVSEGWPVVAYEPTRICDQGLSVSDHHCGLKVTLTRFDH